MEPFKASLPTLSLDLLIQIMEDLHVMDILTLRLTCKALYHATREKFIWLKQLKNSCEQNFIFLPTFPFEKMSPAELERASATPHRSLRVMTQGPTDAQGFVHRHNVRKILRAIHPNNHRPMVYIVPGGRFLLHFSDKIALYDLGYPGATPAPTPEGQTSILTPKATYELKARGRGQFWIYPSGEALRILQDRKSGYQTLEFALLEIYPHHDQPEFAEITHYVPTMTDHWSCVALHRDNLFFIQDEKMKVIDLTNDRWTWWSLSSEHNYQHIMVRENDILTIHEEGAHVWRYPKVDRTGSPFKGKCPKLEPRFSLGHIEDHNRDYQMGDEEAQVFSEWYTGHDNVPLIWDKPQWTINSDDEGDMTEDEDDNAPEDGSNSGSGSAPTPPSTRQRDSVDPENPLLNICRYELRVGKEDSEEFGDDDDREYTTHLDSDYNRWEGEPLSGMYAACAGHALQPLRLCEEAIISLYGRGGKPAYVNVNSVPHLARAADYVPISKDKKKVALFAMGDSLVDRVSFCPFSGRCAYVNVDEDEVDPVVTVFDLVQ